MKLKTNKLLLISIIIIGLTFLFATFWEALGFGKENTAVLAFSMMIAFGLNIAGLIFAFSDKKKDDKKYKIGLFGHLILIIGFFAISGYALLTMN
jgi:hypothetical protein